MPALHFTIQWPDGSEQRCYSPSRVVRELVTAGTSYPVHEFMHRIRAALNIGSERVRAKFGYYCSAAMDQLAELDHRSVDFDPDGAVVVLKIDDSDTSEQPGQEQPSDGSPGDRTSKVS